MATTTGRGRWRRGAAFLLARDDARDRRYDSSALRFMLPHEQGLSGRLMSPEELFAPESTESAVM